LSADAAHGEKVAVTVGIRVCPITDADAMPVGEFLNRNLNPNVSAEHWARSIDVPWSVDRPNGGFMLLDGDDTVVGVNLAFYSDREIDGRRERFCNLGSWCVLPEHRFHSLRLLRALLAQDGYHFTDLSPSGNVLGVNERLGFRFLDNAAVIVPAVPFPSRPGRDVVSADPAVIERTLTGDALELYRDHAATAARHLVLARDGEWCYVVWRKDRCRQVRAFASILYASNPDLLRRMAGPLGRHLLVRDGVLAMIIEQRIADRPRRLAIPLESRRRKMFRSPRLGPAQIDYLYSELVCVSW
jgi:hypothetical protein